MTYKANFYQIPTAIDKDMADHIIKTAHILGGERSSSMIGGHLQDGSFSNGILNTAARNSTHRWMPTDNWLAGMMAHFIRHANLNFYNFDLIGWADQIQYTEYDGPGTHYSWHTDSNDSNILMGGVRKLSITLVLTDPSEYEGGELQIMFPGNKQMETIKPDLGQAIIFPSYACHRVRPIRSGKRVSLVGWYGGPPFR